MTRFGSSVFNCCYFISKRHQKRSQKVWNHLEGMPPDPPSRHSLCVSLHFAKYSNQVHMHWNPPFQNPRSASDFPYIHVISFTCKYSQAFPLLFVSSAFVHMSTWNLGIRLVLILVLWIYPCRLSVDCGLCLPCCIWDHYTVHNVVVCYLFGH